MSSQISMNVRIAATIRQALDKQGIELTWDQLQVAAQAVEAELYDELEESWMYRDLNK